MYIHHYHLQSSQNTQLIYYCQLLTVVVINNLHLIKSFYQNWFSWSTFIFPRKGIKINLFSLGLYYWVNTARNKKDKHVRETPKRRQCRKKQLCSKVDYILFFFFIIIWKKTKWLKTGSKHHLAMVFWCTKKMLPFSTAPCSFFTGEGRGAESLTWEFRDNSRDFLLEMHWILLILCISLTFLQQGCCFLYLFFTCSLCPYRLKPWSNSLF